MSPRRPWMRPYLFEVIVVANLVLIQIIAARTRISVLSLVGRSFIQYTPSLVAYVLVGVLIRAAVAAYRRQLPEYLRVIRTAGWISDTIRLVVFGVLLMHTYFWIKLLVPILHPALMDRQLWDLEQTLFFGISPTVLITELFGQGAMLRVIDWSYARIFFVSLTVAFVYFLSDASRRLRVAFTTGNSILWLMGAWLYLLIPSVGPAFRFPEIWLPLEQGLPLTQHFQALLMRNYQNVLRLVHGAANVGDIRLEFGVAAFPSLHVAFQTYAFLWMRRVWIYGQIVFGVFAAVILIGSVVTGWHYLIDGIAGAAMAGLAYWVSSGLWQVGQWLRLRRMQRAP